MVGSFVYVLVKLYSGGEIITRPNAVRKLYAARHLGAIKNERNLVRLELTQGDSRYENYNPNHKRI
jgi:hypothetical protein